MPDRGLAPIPPEARPYQGRPAGLVTRTVAAVVDGVIVGLALLVAYGGVALVVFVVSPTRFELPAAGLLLSLTTALFASIGYLGLSWWLAGHTWGGRLMGLRVVSRSGGDLSLGVALVRAAACVLFPVGLLWAAVSRGNRSLQDVVLRTRVVYDWQG